MWLFQYMIKSSQFLLSCIFNAETCITELLEVVIYKRNVVTETLKILTDFRACLFYMNTLLTVDACLKTPVLERLY